MGFDNDVTIEDTAVATRILPMSIMIIIVRGFKIIDACLFLINYPLNISADMFCELTIVANDEGASISANYENILRRDVQLYGFGNVILAPSAPVKFIELCEKLKGTVIKVSGVLAGVSRKTNITVDLCTMGVTNEKGNVFLIGALTHAVKAYFVSYGNGIYAGCRNEYNHAGRVCKSTMYWCGVKNGDEVYTDYQNRIVEKVRYCQGQAEDRVHVVCGNRVHGYVTLEKAVAINKARNSSIKLVM
jgi:hypothetical protein